MSDVRNKQFNYFGTVYF